MCVHERGEKEKEKTYIFLKEQWPDSLEEMEVFGIDELS